LRRVHRAAQYYARRRRLGVGSLADSVWQRDERGEHALPAQHPHTARGWEQRRLQGQPSHPDRDRDAVRQLSAIAGQRLRVRSREIRDAEHRRAVAVVVVMKEDRSVMRRAGSIWIVVIVAALASLSAAGNSLPLIDAVKAGNVESVRALIKQRVDVNAASPDGTTALHWA